MTPIPSRLLAMLLLGLALLLPQTGHAQMRAPSEPSPQSHPYVGMWITADGRIRHNLLPNGRYDEARGQRESAYQGRYEVQGNHIEYWDDTGFTADGDFIGDVLHHGGMVFYRAGDSRIRPGGR